MKEHGNRRRLRRYGQALVQRHVRGLQLQRHMHELQLHSAAAALLARLFGAR